MRKNLLKFSLLSLVLLLLGGVNAWAEVTKVDSRALWLFNSLNVENYTDNQFPQNTTNNSNNVDLNGEGLIYTGNTGSSLKTITEEEITINSETVSEKVTQVIQLQESYDTGWTDAFKSTTRTGELYNSTLSRSLVVNVTRAGTLYVLVKHTGNIAEQTDPEKVNNVKDNKRLRCYELLFNSTRTYSENSNNRYIHKTVNIYDNNETLTELSLHGDGAGAFWFRVGLQSDVYAILFVPDLEAPTIETVEGTNKVRITPGLCHIDGATTTTYYTAGGTLSSNSAGKIEGTDAQDLELSADATVKAFTVSSTSLTSSSTSFDFTYTYTTTIPDAPTVGDGEAVISQKTLIKFSELNPDFSDTNTTYEVQGLYFHGKSNVTVSAVDGSDEVAFGDANDTKFTATKYAQLSTGFTPSISTLNNRTANSNSTGIAGSAALNIDRAGSLYVVLENTAFDAKLVGRYHFLYFNNALVDSKIITKNNDVQVLSYRSEKAGTFYFSCGYSYRVRGVLFVPDVLDYTITFDSDGGSAVDAITKMAGEEVTAPTAPTKDGYIFTGWYNGNEAYTFTTMPEENLTLTAHWTAATVQKDDANTENSAKESYTITDAENATLTAVTVNDATDLKIPADVNGIPVTSIAADAFTAENTAGVKSIDLSNTHITLTGNARGESSPLKNVDTNTIIYLPSTSNAEGVNVVKSDGTCKEVLISEAKSFVNSKGDITTTKFTFDRTFVNGDGLYNTVFLPVEIPQAVATMLGTFYTCTSVSEGAAVLTPVSGDLAANTAYIFKPKDGSTSINYDGTETLTIKVNNSVANPTGAGLKGTNIQKTIAELATSVATPYGYAGDATGGATVGAFYKLLTTATVPAYRAWLEIFSGGSPAPQRLSIVVEGEDGTTGIRSIDGTPVDDVTPVYNLNGQHVSKSYKGLVIKNGKKMINK